MGVGVVLADPTRQHETVLLAAQVHVGEYEIGRRVGIQHSFRIRDAVPLKHLVIARRPLGLN